MFLATLVFHPESIAAWLAVGLATGWLAPKVLGEANYGVIGDLILGAIGALVAAMLVSVLVAGDPEFWIPLVLAFVGACIVLGVGRAIALRRAA